MVHQADQLQPGRRARDAPGPSGVSQPTGAGRLLADVAHEDRRGGRLRRRPGEREPSRGGRAQDHQRSVRRHRAVPPGQRHLQGSDDLQLVAKLGTVGLFSADKYTSNYPKLDSAPGGTLDSFGIAAAMFNAITGQGAVAPYPDVNFIPTISAMAVTQTDIRNPDDLAPTSTNSTTTASSSISTRRPRTAPATPRSPTNCASSSEIRANVGRWWLFRVSNNGDEHRGGVSIHGSGQSLALTGEWSRWGSRCTLIGTCARSTPRCHS